MGQLYTNNASTRLAIAIDDVETTVVVDAGTGVLFPQPVEAEDYFVITLENTLGQLEICKCVSRAADTLVVERAQEGTIAVAHAVESRVECRLTAGTMANLMRADGPVCEADLDLNGNAMVNGEIVGVPLRGASGVTSNEIDVPAGGLDPTIGGSKIWHSGNDGAASGLDADTVDGLQAADFIFPAGTRMLFHQAAPPTGWTADASITDHALKVAASGGGTAGTVNFSTLFGRTATDEHTLTGAESGTSNHGHGLRMCVFTQTTARSYTTGGLMMNYNALEEPAVHTSTATSAEPGGQVAGAVAADAASGHSHDMDMRVKYATVVVGVKD